MADRRDERRRRVQALRAGGESLRNIGAELGVSAATVMRDLRAGASAETPERPVTASDAPGAGKGTDGVDLSDYESVTAEMQRLYVLMASGVRVPVNQTRLIERRHAELGRQETVCATHIAEADYITEVHWRDDVWVTQLQVALRRLTASGAKDAEGILNEMLERVSALTAVGRPQNRS